MLHVFKRKEGHKMENENSSKLGVAILYALVAALIGGIIWGAIIIIFNYQIGFIALAIGGLTGYSVILAAKENLTQSHRIVAVIASLIGIVIGKYIGFAYTFNDGFEAFLDPFTRASFGQYFDVLFGFVDIVFILLAMVTAWQVPTKFAKGNKGEENTTDMVLDANEIESQNFDETAANTDSDPDPEQTGQDETTQNQ